MFSPFLLGMAALLQQAGQSQQFQGATTPPSGDTVGYWQQRVHYEIVATLDEAQSKLISTAKLTYVNNSPDTLREMYFHQYLNAFRPGSKWSAVDVRENRERFQHLGPADIGYERFTQAPVVDGTPVLIDYPGAPDSTVVHFRLSRPLAPHDSIVIQFAWDARPSTVTRRQGRRGRTYDFAQWFPKVAVYDRAGWEPNPLVPAGELYGEYGTYDVTMIVRDDQVIASSGVPIAGDPGWARVSRNGAPYLAANAYGSRTPPSVGVPPGYRAVTFRAENVHHFAWSASPDYRYEGGVYVRRAGPTHFKTWDTVAVHVLYKADDDTTWGGGRALDRTLFAARWLESVWGPYAYPQITNVHRLDPGGTEFPMMIMDGSAGQSLILHEFGHVFTYGILGNNEWRSGWLDEGLTDYQTSWALKETPQDRARVIEPARLAPGYRVNAVTIAKSDSLGLAENRWELLERAQPIGTPAYAFAEFGIYNEMIYNRAKVMYGQLRELMGDSVFLRFTHDYYDRWALKHVDERAMRASAERAYGHSLGWFFDQWVHHTGLMDYALGSYKVQTDGTRFETLAQVERRGDLRHPMPVGVLTDAGWTIARADVQQEDVQTVRIVTTQQPRRVQLDPFQATFDWDRRNDVPATVLLGVIPEPRFTFNWPWLSQTDRTHTLAALSPAAWYSDPQGGILGLRAKTNYLSTVDLYDFGIGFASRAAPGADGFASTARRVQAWARGENLYLPGMSRPLMGVGGGINYLDGLFKADAYHEWDLSPFVLTPGPAIKARLYTTVALPTDKSLLPEQWVNVQVGELGGSASYRTAILADSGYVQGRASLGFGAAMNGDSLEPVRGYTRAEVSLGIVQPLASTSTQLRLRLFAAVAPNAPKQRSIFASTQDPFATFNNDLFRPRGALFKQDGVNYLPLGGAGLRGFAIDVPLDGVGALNGEILQRLFNAKGQWGRATISLSGFGDVAVARSRYLTLPDKLLSDAGAGLVVDGRLYDRDVRVRLDAPVFVNRVSLAGGRGLGGNGSVAPRWTITVGDLW